MIMIVIMPGEIPVVADKDDREARNTTGFRRKSPYLVGNPAPQPFGKTLAVDEAGSAHRPISDKAMRGNTTLCKMMTMISATIGVRSSAPKSGMILRIGR